MRRSSERCLLGDRGSFCLTCKSSFRRSVISIIWFSLPANPLQLNVLEAADLAKARHAFESRYRAAKYGSLHIREHGSIALTIGVAGRRPLKGWTVAASVCGTIDALARALAVELAPIRVNVTISGRT
jgi:hypothetical protein